jgi:biopolymer transport protein ExbD
MKPFFYCFILTILVSCGKEKIVQLPKINHSEISKINDVSPAYLFYNVTMPDSIELNRKNLISTTNWLVNVDKRLTLKQVVPKIKFLQEKKQKSEHKNENAKNYFTCNDISKHSLGFIDFTNVIYHTKSSKDYLKTLKPKVNQIVNIRVHTLDSTYVSFIWNDTTFVHSSNQKELLNHLESNLTNQGNAIIVSELDKTLSFQDYITYKYLLSQIDLKNVTIANDEFVFN